MQKRIEEKGQQSQPKSRRQTEITPASTPNIIENDDDSDDNGDNNYDDDDDNGDYGVMMMRMRMRRIRKQR